MKIDVEFVVVRPVEPRALRGDRVLAYHVAHVVASPLLVGKPIQRGFRSALLVRDNILTSGRKKK